MNSKQITATNVDELMDQREQSQTALSPCRIGTTSSTNFNSSGGLMTSRKDSKQIFDGYLVLNHFVVVVVDNPFIVTMKYL